MRVINIVDSLQKVNFGIWNAAIATSQILKETYHVESECWYIPNSDDIQLPSHINSFELESEVISNLDTIINDKNLDPHNTVIVTHGCWRFPSRLGAEFTIKGFKWVYVPHGMLEPWSMAQKRIKKLLYFNIIEKHLIQKASIIRAVGSPELRNLRRKFGDNCLLIPNGIPCEVDDVNKATKNTFLFMARLHHKKGIIPLVHAWLKSTMNNKENYELIIAGPDDGELDKLQRILHQAQSTNINYVGAKYGDEKRELLLKSRFYILPSHSEGFPTSVLEAMHFGLIPVITAGCNFPEAFENNVAIRTNPATRDILRTLMMVDQMKDEKLKEISVKAKELVDNHFSLERVARQQYELYKQLVNH